MRIYARFIVLAALTFLSACATLSYENVKLGRLGGRVLTMWVGENNFLYIPSPQKDGFWFETAITGKTIRPGLMYTDGGSIPRFAQGIKGFSPWGFGPAYVIHDWIFYGHHCVVDGKDDGRFSDVKRITFDESALILAEAIKTLVDYGQVKEQILATDIIAASVDSVVARALWDKNGACDSIDPWHIAVAWKAVLGPRVDPPCSWKISRREIEKARALLPRVPHVLSESNRAPTIARSPLAVLPNTRPRCDWEVDS
jgi:hypothetical protein